MTTTATYGYAALDNLGPNGWSLYARTGQVVHLRLFTNDQLAEDESPIGRALAELATWGWQVAGDGSWQVGAWTGPEADTTWTRIQPQPVGGDPQ